jgi:hypothetical protein
VNTNNLVIRATAYLEQYSLNENSTVADLLDSLHVIEFIEIIEDTLGRVLTDQEITTCISLSVGKIPQFLQDIEMLR